MACQLMTILNDPADQGRKPLRHPAEDKESRLHPSGVELVKDPVGVQIDTARERLPIGAVYTLSECLDLKVVLDIHGHGVVHWHHTCPVTLASRRSSTRLNTCPCRNACRSSFSIRLSRSLRSSTGRVIPLAGSSPAPKSRFSSSAVSSTIWPVMVWVSSRAPSSSTSEQSVL